MHWYSNSLIASELNNESVKTLGSKNGPDIINEIQAKIIRYSYKQLKGLSLKNMKVKFLHVAFLLAIFFSCQKEEITSPIPKISYIGFNRIQYQNNPSDSLVVVRFNFEDGDGDIGLGSNDTLPPFDRGSNYYYNVFVEYYELNGGTYSQVIDAITLDTVNFNDRVPPLKPDSRFQSIFGEMQVRITPTVFQQIPDSVKFRIMIMDRSLKESNKIWTPGIKINY